MTRIAVVHEWIDAHAGSEQVFEAMAEALPTADLFALTRKPDIELGTGGREIRTTFLDRDSLRDRRGLTLPLMPTAWRLLGKQGYDAVLTSHHAFAHTNQLAAGAHLVYVHSPARYLWTPDIDGRASSHAMAPARQILKRIDVSAAQQVTSLRANSTTVSKRVQDFWGRQAPVMYPPVRVEYFSHEVNLNPTRDYLLGVGRWIGYKNLGMVIEVAEHLQMPVKIAGRGPERDYLEAIKRRTRVPVELLESPTNEQLRDLYQNAYCLVFPTIEDFGIVPVEAQAAGTAVVAPRAGGVMDTVQDGKTGVLVGDVSVEALARGVRNLPESSAAACRQNAVKFSRKRFIDSVQSWVQDHVSP